MKILQQLLTGADNATHDLGRWSWAGSWVAVVATASWKLWHGIELDLQGLATAMSTVAAAHGAALFAKAKTEPQAPQ